MQVICDPEKLAAGSPCTVALGQFDGVHAGHAKLIRSAVSHARETGTRCVVLTFRENPACLLKKDDAPGFIQSPEERLHEIEALGADVTVLAEFDARMADLPGRAFASLLKEKLFAESVFCGFNYTFGAGGVCSPKELAAFGNELGFRVFVTEEVKISGETVSSTRIRRALAEGDMEKAEELLGHPYTICGIVLSGKRLGRTIGFPTANLNLEAGRALPKAGVYVCKLYRDGEWLPAVANIGTQPTAPSGIVTLEAHTLVDPGDLYGKYIRVHLIRFLRGETRFASLDALKQQLEADKERAREVLLL